MHEPIELQLSSKVFRMVLSGPAIKDYEAATGTKFMKVWLYNFSDVASGKLSSSEAVPSYTETAALIWATAKRQSKNASGLTQEFVEEALGPQEFNKAISALCDLVRIGLGLPDPKEVPDEELTAGTADRPLASS